MSSSCTCHINPDKCEWCKLQNIKGVVDLNFEITKKNAHVLDEKDYIKMNTFISFENLFWLIEQAEKAEWIEKESDQIILEKTEKILKLEEENEKISSRLFLLEPHQAIILNQSEKIMRYEEAIKNAIHFLEKNSGTYDEPRRLTIGEMTELYDLLISQIKNK